MPCEGFIGNEPYFLGSAACFESLPMQRLSGYWVTGFEYSVFYSDLKSIPPESDPNAPWLFADAAVVRAGGAPQNDGRRHVFEVSFIGAYSKKKGFYGNGAYTTGVYVKRFLSVKEIK